jgi:hypothetical protein
MPSALKALQKMRNNPRDWRIEDLKVVAAHLGIDYRQRGASHVIFSMPQGSTLPVPVARPTRPVYVRQFVTLIDTMEGRQ